MRVVASGLGAHHHSPPFRRSTTGAMLFPGQPDVAHDTMPRTAAPSGELLYVWGLARAKEEPLCMWDVSDTAFLAHIGAAATRPGPQKGPCLPRRSLDS